MATDVEALLLTIEANTKKLEKDMAKANAVFAKQAKALEDKSKALNDKLGIKANPFASGLAVAGNSIKGFIAATAGLLSVGAAIGATMEEIKRLADVADDSKKIGITAEELQGVQVAAKLAGSSADEATRALVYFNKEVGESGDASSKLAALFRANGVAMRDAKGELLPISDLLEKFATIVSRAKNEQEAAAMAALGFGKAGSGMVPLLKEMSGGISSVVDKAKGMGLVMSNELVDRADEFDDKWNAAVGRLKIGMAEFALNTGLAVGAVDLLTAALIKASQVPLTNIPKGAPEQLADSFGFGIAEAQRRSAAENQAAHDASYHTGGGFGDTQYNFDPVEARKEAARAKAYGVLPKIGAPKPSVMPNLGGAGSSGDSLDELEREIRSLQEKGALLATEISMVGKSTEEREKAIEKQKLENAAAREKIKLTPKQLEGLDALAAGYAKQVAELEKLKKSEEDAKRAAEHLGDAAVDALSDIILDGKNAGEVMQTLAKSLAKAVLQSALMGSGPLGGLFGGGLIKGAMGSLFGVTFAEGGVMTGSGPMPLRRYAAGGVASSPQLALYGEGSRPEAFVPLPDGRRIPVALRLPSAERMMPRASGNTTVAFAPVIDARGADAAAVARLERGLKDLAASIPGQVARVQRLRDVRGVRPT